MFTEMMMSVGGKRVEGDFNVINGSVSVTVNGLTNIELVMAYNPSALNAASSASKYNGNFIATNVNGYGITNINENTFTINWTTTGAWKYIAYGN